MPPKADIGSKRLIGLDPEGWVQWVTQNPQVRVQEIMKGGGDEPTIRQALRTLQQDLNLSEMEPLLAFFASFVSETQLVADIMRWDMTVLRESPWYQEIEQKGIQLGKQEGIQLGKQEGIQIEAERITRKLLANGMDPTQITTITGLSLERIRHLQTNNSL